MDLRQLEYFVAAANAGGMRRAARQLFVTQPAITNGIHSLEAELGVVLFERTPYGVTLTDPGREFLGHASEILARTQSAKDAMQRVSGRPRTVVRLGLASGMISAGELTAPIVDAYRSAFPRVRLDVTEVSFQDQTSPVLSGNLDAAIVRGPLELIQDPRLVITPIAVEPRVLLVSTRHDLADADALDVDEVMDQTALGLVCPAEWGDFWQLADVRGARRISRTCAPARTIAEIVLSIATSSAVMSIPGSMARMTPSPFVTGVPLRGAEPAQIGVARRADDSRPAVHEFVRIAQTVATDNIGLLEGARLPA